MITHSTLKGALLNGALVVGVTAVSSAGVALGATASSFLNSKGDYVLDDAQNWSNGVLPHGAAYEATVGIATTEEKPYVMKGVSPSSLTPYTINHSKVDTVFDLGAGNRFVGLNRFNFNVSATTMTVKSGEVGVDWDSANGDRFFMGDGIYNASGRIDVDGPDAVLSSSKKSNIQIGVNGKKFRVNVKNGATIRGNVSLGVSRTDASDNVLWIEGPGSKMEVPSGGTVDALVVGGFSPRNVCVVTNQAAVYVRSGKPIKIGAAGNSGKTRSHQNAMAIADHSTVSVNGDFLVGSDGSENQLIVSSGSSVTATTFTVSANPNSHAFDVDKSLVYSNKAMFADEGTLLKTTSLYVGHTYANDAQLVITNGAGVVADSVVVGYSKSTNNVLSVCADSAVNTKSVSVGYSASYGNRVIVDGGVLAITNETPLSNSMVFGVGRGSSGNVFEVTNGGVVDIKNLYQIRVGANDGSTANSNRLVVSNGGVFRYKAASAKGYFTIGGGYGSHNGLEVDGAGFYAKDSILSVGGSRTGNYVRLTNGATCEVYRVYFNENGCQGQTVDVNDSTLSTGKDSFGYTGGITIGSNATSTNHLLHVHGPRAYVYVADGMTLARDSELRFTVEAGGFARSPVLSSPRGLKANDNGTVTAEHPTTIRIDVGKGFKGKGTYKLIETSTKDLDWTNVNLVYDARRVRIVEKSNRRLVVNVSTSGFMMVVR